MRSDWVYVGRTEAAVLGGISNRQIERWTASGELVTYRLQGERCAGRPRSLYRVDNLLALVKAMRR